MTGSYWGTILALLLYPVALLWAFAARSLWRVSVVLAGCSSICGNQPQFFCGGVALFAFSYVITFRAVRLFTSAWFPVHRFHGKMIRIIN
jgi:hypothetical protein